MKKWKQLASEIAFANKWFTVRRDTVELPSGLVLDDYFVWQSQAVAMVVPVTNDQQFVLVRQYKHAVGEILLEFPAGYVEEGEDASTAAARELTEETGFVAQTLRPLATFTHNPTKETGRMYVFLGVNCDEVGEKHSDATEDIEVLTMSPEDMLQHITSGSIWSTSTVAAAFLALRHLRKMS